MFQANPTGPLHVGHGRSAAYAACVANLLKAVGYRVHREYYVNDAGRQMRILGLSTWIRYLQVLDEPIDLPKNAYQGDYIREIAHSLRDQYGIRFLKNTDQLNIRIAQLTQTDADRYIDAYIDVAVDLLGEEEFNLIRKTSLQQILEDIKNDLSDFGVIYDNWFMKVN